VVSDLVKPFRTWVLAQETVLLITIFVVLYWTL
jgi:hypothetical protein